MKKKCSAHLFWGQDLGRDQKSIFLVLYCFDLYSIERDHLLGYNQHYMTLGRPELDPNSFINMLVMRADDQAHIVCTYIPKHFQSYFYEYFSYYYFIYYFYFSEKSCHFKLKPQSHLFCTYWKNAACKSLPTEAWKFEISQILRKMLSAIGLLLGHVALRPILQLRIYIYWSILIIFQTIPNYLKNSFYNCLIIINDSQYFSTFLIKKNSSLYH